MKSNSLNSFANTVEKVVRFSINIAAFLKNIEAVKQNLAAVVDVNATNVGGDTSFE